MDRKGGLDWSTICTVLGAIIVTTIGNALGLSDAIGRPIGNALGLSHVIGRAISEHLSHEIGKLVLAGLGAGLGSLIEHVIGRRTPDDHRGSGNRRRPDYMSG